VISITAWDPVACNPAGNADQEDTHDRAVSGYVDMLERALVVCG
jgi:hypothetical protein